MGVMISKVRLNAHKEARVYNRSQRIPSGNTCPGCTTRRVARYCYQCQRRYCRVCFARNHRGHSG